MYNSIFKLPTAQNLSPNTENPAPNTKHPIPNTHFSIDDILNIAYKAGQKIMEIYSQDFDIEYKDDKSPLTLADKNSNKVIIENIRKYNLPVLSEEEKEIPYDTRKNWELFWMIDPLDGTKEFIKKNGEFTVNIALIHKNEPIFGVVYAPAINEIYFTDNEFAYKANLFISQFELKNIIKLPKTKNQKSNTLTIVASKSHMNNETKKFIDNTIKTISTIKTIKTISKGSSLKLCMVAEGVADIYPRLAPTMEWDTAAADAVVRKSGKNTYKISTNDYRLLTNLEYNKENLLNPWFVVK